MAAAGRIAENIVQFARVLRAAGMPVGPARVVDAVRAVEVAGLTSRDDLYWTLHAVFVSRREQHLIFDGAFDVFWRARDLVAKMIALMSPVAPPNRAPEPPKAGATRIGEALAGSRIAERPDETPRLEIDARLTMSDREILQRKDFAQMTAAELAQARAVLARMALPLDRIRTRRLQPAARGRHVDLRATLRQSVRAGGAFPPLRMRAPVERPPPVVALIDISGSMTEYSRVFLHFMHALAEARPRVFTFLFGTRLTNVTRALRRRDPDEALAQVTALVPDWSGGTRIGQALADFNRLWSRRVMAGGPIVLLMTDGLERQEQSDLGRQTERLAKSCRRLMWLNPLLRFDGFEPKAAGIRAMLPHVDDFVPVHSLGAVEDLCRALDGKHRSCGISATHPG